jgi:hypothetical protein
MCVSYFLLDPFGKKVTSAEVQEMEEEIKHFGM